MGRGNPIRVNPCLKRFACFPPRLGKSDAPEIRGLFLASLARHGVNTPYAFGMGHGLLCGLCKIAFIPAVLWKKGIGVPRDLVARP